MRFLVEVVQTTTVTVTIEVEAASQEAAIAEQMMGDGRIVRHVAQVVCAPVSAVLVPQLGGVDLVAGCELEFIAAVVTMAGVPCAPGDSAVVRDAQLQAGAVVVLLVHRTGSALSGDVPRELEAPEWVPLAWLAAVARVRWER